MTTNDDKVDPQAIIKDYELKMKKLQDQIKDLSSDESPSLPKYEPKNNSSPIPSFPTPSNSFTSNHNYLNRGQIVDCLLRCGYLEETLNTLTNYKSALEYELGMMKYTGPMNYFVINKHFDRLRIPQLTKDKIDVRERIVKMAEKRREEFELKNKNNQSWNWNWNWGQKRSDNNKEGTVDL
jgi:hypothetical protein